MKKIYFARRIQSNPSAKLILDVRKEMSPQDIHVLYVEKEEKYRNYIHNGHWILRPPITEDNFSLNTLPNALRPLHVWHMVRQKIEESNIFFGVINVKAFGTIAEVGYACKCNMAVYILPDENVTKEELEDLWFLFQMVQTTRLFWHDIDFQVIEDFSRFNINSVDEYLSYIETIVPVFMKK